MLHINFSNDLFEIKNFKKQDISSGFSPSPDTTYAELCRTFNPFGSRQLFVILPRVFHLMPHADNIFRNFCTLFAIFLGGSAMRISDSSLLFKKVSNSVLSTR